MKQTLFCCIATAFLLFSCSQDEKVQLESEKFTQEEFDNFIKNRPEPVVVHATEEEIEQAMEAEDLLEVYRAMKIEMEKNPRANSRATMLECNAASNLGDINWNGYVSSQDLVIMTQLRVNYGTGAGKEHSPDRDYSEDEFNWDLHKKNLDDADRGGWPLPDGYERYRRFPINNAASLIFPDRFLTIEDQKIVRDLLLGICN